MTTALIMSTPELDLLRLVQWLSPAFPTGAYAYSHGLEQAVVAGEVRSEADLRAWLSDILDHGAGWNDAVLLACGLRGEDLGALADLARALAGTAERLKETEEQGAAFARARAEMTGTCTNAMPLPLALAKTAKDLRLAPEQVIALFQHAFASSLVSAGVRFIPLGQAAGQRVLAALHPKIVELSARAATATTADLAQSAFRAEIASAAHETLEVRIFKT
ncbi:urease accessory protein UreF [Rhodobacter capsulatus]